MQQAAGLLGMAAPPYFLEGRWVVFDISRIHDSVTLTQEMTNALNREMIVPRVIMPRPMPPTIGLGLADAPVPMWSIPTWAAVPAAILVRKTKPSSHRFRLGDRVRGISDYDGNRKIVNAEGTVMGVAEAAGNYFGVMWDVDVGGHTGDPSWYRQVPHGRGWNTPGDALKYLGRRVNPDKVV